MLRKVAVCVATVALGTRADGAIAAQLAAARIVVVDDRGARVGDAELFAVKGGTLVPLGRAGSSGEASISADAGELLVARSGTRASSPAKLTGDGMRIVIPTPRIGSVQARNDRRDEKTITALSDSAVVFDDVALARSLVPNYRSRAQGGSGQETLNGVPLELPSGPGANASDEPGVPSDLIDSFSATQSDDGTVTPNYHLLSPTPAVALRFTSGLAANDGSLWKASVSGTTHRLGYALVVATGADDGPLAGATLTDASGERYDHSTHARHTDVSLTLSRAIGATQVNAAGFTSLRNGDDIDPTLPGGVLTGSGPGNSTRKATAFDYVIASQTHGRDSYHALDARFSGSSADDAGNALVAGSPAAYSSGYRYSGNYDEFAFTRAFNTASLTLKGTLTRTSTTGYLTTAAFASAVPLQAGQSTLGISYERNTGAHGYGIQVDRASRFGSFAGSDIEARAHVKTTVAGTALVLSATHSQAQTQQAYSAGAYDFSAPTTASITCTSPSATVTGPAPALGRHPTADTLNARINRALPRNASISAGGFISYGRDSLVFPASQLGATLDPAYRSALDANYALLCPGTTLSANQIFVQRFETVPRLIGREWFVDAALPLGPLRAELTYETYSLVAPQTAPDLAGVQSTLIPGAQLPGVPLHRANALLSYRNRRLVLATALQYTSANNVDALPGHVSVALGAQLPVGPGVLAVAAQNLFHAYSGTYVSPKYAVPLTTTAGVLPTLAAPLRPVWSLRYTLPLGPSPTH